MKIENVIGPSAALALGVYADLAFNAYSALNSSPQTTELFAAEREETLMKYVLIADAVVLAFGILGSLLGQNPWPFIGAGVVMAGMHLLYVHAAKSGTGSE